MRFPIGAALVLALAGCVTPGQSRRAEQSAKAEAIFEKLKSLEGRWVQMDVEGAVAEAGTEVIYEVTAAGSAVIETEFAGMDHEMVTVYTLDDRNLRLTHYCAMGNQPTMYADPITDENRVTFEAFAVGGEDDSDNPHMHWADIRFLGPDRVDTVWTIRQKDGSRGFVGKMNLVRAN